jgi:D-3-phosphoglycerate dehydrogenase / 2-oxoglutarate reductase
MPVNLKRVFYVEYLASPAFAEILARRPDVSLERLENHTPEHEAAPVLAAAHTYQIGAARDEIDPKYYATADLLARAPNLVAVSSNGAGYDTVDLRACTAAGVLAVNQSGGNREAVAEHALGMMLALSKRIVETDRRMRAASGIPRNDYIGNDLLGRTVGIVGLGNVGSRLAELCRGLFRMRVLAYDPYLGAEQIAARGAEKVELDALMAEADFVSINCPRTEETLGMVGAARFALMRPHAYFITTARGGIHDERALAAALREGRIAGAGLDVWDKEPPPHDDPLLAFDNVIASPHTAGVTRQARTNMATIAAEQMLDILDGKRPERLLNPEVWPAYAARFERIMGFQPRG